jgi:hypothetical protein
MIKMFCIVKNEIRLWHQWSKWEQYDQQWCKTNKLTGVHIAGSNFIIRRQKRNCEICGKEEDVLIHSTEGK